MIDSEQPEFLELLGDLFGAHSRNVKADIAGGYWKGLRRMTLAEFRTCVEVSIEKLQYAERGLAQPPTVAELWDLYRMQQRKIAKPLELAAPDDHVLDGWDLNANTLLLNYLTLGLVQKAIHDRKATRDAARYAPPAHTAILVKWKNAWSRDMREDRSLYGGKLDGKKFWTDCMAAAELEIDKLLGAERAAA